MLVKAQRGPIGPAFSSSHSVFTVKEVSPSSYPTSGLSPGTIKCIYIGNAIGRMSHITKFVHFTTMTTTTMNTMIN